MKQSAGEYAIGFMILALGAGIAAGPAGAQHVVGAKAGIIQYVRGIAFLDDKPVNLSSNSYLLMRPGQNLRTEFGFAELLLSPEVYLRMGTFGLLRIEQNRLGDTRIELEKGSAMVEVVQEIKGTQASIFLKGGEARIKKKGLYRFDAGSGEIRVYGGSALVSIANRKTTVKGGRTVSLETGLGIRKFDTKEVDPLHQWAAQRSFELYQAPSGNRVQTHWQRLTMGWAVNSNYRMRFFSERLLREWRTRQHVPLEVRIAAEQAQKRVQEAREYLEQKAIRDRKELEASRNQGIMPSQ